MNLEEIFSEYGVKAEPNMILDMWNESGRYWHNIDHFYDLFNQINKLSEDDNLSNDITKKLILIALFHDIIYDVSKNDNEEKSANFFIGLCVDKNNSDVVDIYNSIIDTKDHKSNNKISEIFNKLDMSVVEQDYEKLMEWEEKISKEYIPFYGEDKYKIGRVDFLNSLVDKYPMNSMNLLKLIEFIESKY